MMARSQSHGDRATIDDDDDNREFESFLDRWMMQQQQCLGDLSSAQQRLHGYGGEEEDLEALISRVLSHYEQHYTNKSKEASKNVYRVISPAWFTPFERTFLWIGGFRPSLAVRVGSNSVSDLSEEQSRMMQRLMGWTRKEERELADQLARVQESVGAPPLLGLARRSGGLWNGDLTAMVSERPIQELGSAMEVVVARADLLRMETVKGVVEIMSPIQGIKFLAAMMKLQIDIRKVGLEKEAESNAV